MAMKTRYTVVDGEVIAEKRNGTRKQYVPDPLGSTMALLDNTQAQTDTFAYWPYGEEASRTGTTSTSFRFVGTQGYYRDGASRTYVRARTLDTGRGRWLTQDPIGFEGGDWNLYRYAAARPTSEHDRSGLLIGNWCGLGYGKCCGPLRAAQCNGRTPITQGEDCLDRACCKHDCCMQSVSEFFVRQHYCNQQLCNDVKKCSPFTCWGSPHKLGCLTARATLLLYACTI